MRSTVTAAFVVGVLVLSGCQSPDVGGPCKFPPPTDSSLPDLNTIDVPTDFFESGNPGCDNLVCIKSPPQPGTSKVKNNPYCSKACVSDSDCFQSDTGLVCRPVTPDPNYIKTLPQSVQDQYAKMLGDIQFSSYCAAPLQ
jgi:hypothetical protein